VSALQGRLHRLGEVAQISQTSVRRIMKGQTQPDDTGFVVLDHAAIISRDLFRFQIYMPISNPSYYFELYL
jgi:hypothetical protein